MKSLASQLKHTNMGYMCHETLWQTNQPAHPHALSGSKGTVKDRTAMTECTGRSLLSDGKHGQADLTLGMEHLFLYSRWNKIMKHWEEYILHITAVQQNAQVLSTSVTIYTFVCYCSVLLVRKMVCVISSLNICEGWSQSLLFVYVLRILLGISNGL